MTSPWIVKDTPEEILLTAMQKIAFDDLADLEAAIDVAQDALHGAGFATLRGIYTGTFDLAWLEDGERVRGAGDGTSAAIVVSADGSERRINVGDEVRL